MVLMEHKRRSDHIHVIKTFADRAENPVQWIITEGLHMLPLADSASANMRVLRSGSDQLGADRQFFGRCRRHRS